MSGAKTSAELLREHIEAQRRRAIGPPVSDEELARRQLPDPRRLSLGGTTCLTLLV